MPTPISVRKKQNIMQSIIVLMCLVNPLYPSRFWMIIDRFASSLFTPKFWFGMITAISDALGTLNLCCSQVLILDQEQTSVLLHLYSVVQAELWTFRWTDWPHASYFAGFAKGLWTSNCYWISKALNLICVMDVHGEKSRLVWIGGL
jgi:hypothetical protein